MTERGLIVDAREAKGLHDGSITAIVRVVETQPNSKRVSYGCLGGKGFGFFFGETFMPDPFEDRLWLKETWRIQMNAGFYDIQFRADMMTKDCGSRVVEMGSRKPPHMVWQPSSRMSRWASRTLLGVNEVKAVRVQDVTEEDALAFGVWKDEQYWHGGIHPVKGSHQCWNTHTEACLAFVEPDSDKRGRGANPWLWLAKVAKV